VDWVVDGDQLHVLEEGTVLRRTYKGREYLVQVVEGNKIHFEGGVYRSLTDVVRMITGQRAISGPAFFGVAERGKRTGQIAAALAPKPLPTDAAGMTRRVCDELASMMETKVGWNGALRTGKGGLGGHKDWDCAITVGGQVSERLTQLTKQDAASWAQLTKQAVSTATEPWPH